MRTTLGKLAIEGGTPVRAQLLPYGRPLVDEDDIAAVNAVLRSTWLTTGPKVREFEEAFADCVGAKHAVAVANGTAALHCAAWAADLGPDDIAVVPALTFAATANCVRYQGATVAFADVRGDTLNVDVAALEATMPPSTKAVVTVDYAGQPSDLDELAALCRRRGIVLIEDAAHALGAEYRGRRVGSLADLTTFSLHPVKLMTTGEGGVVTTDDDEMARRMRAFRNHGISADHRQRAANDSWVYDVQELGYNYRLTDIQCALGLSQLRKVRGWLTARQDLAARYARALGVMRELVLPVVLDDRTSAWHLYVVRLQLERLTVGRDQIFRALRAENIGVNVHYIPVPWHGYYQRLGYRKGQWPVAEDAYERMLTLPLFPGMSEADFDDVVRAVVKVVEHYAV